MRIGVSNIAWDIAEDEAIAEVLAACAVDAIDVAPSKYFADVRRTSPYSVRKVREWWEARGVCIVGMQALLYGTSGLNLFGAPEIRDAMLEHLAAVCAIAQTLGADRLVFGSPHSRDRSGLDDGAAMARAVDFFRRLGDVAGSHAVILCLEPNPAAYGSNFMMTSEETAAVVRATSHPNIAMTFDTGALTMNGERPEVVLERHADIVAHVHVSEPDLVATGRGGTDHAAMALALQEHVPGLVASIEMVATRDEPHVAAVARALGLASTFYRSAPGHS